MITLFFFTFFSVQATEIKQADPAATATSSSFTAGEVAIFNRQVHIPSSEILQFFDYGGAPKVNLPYSNFFLPRIRSSDEYLMTFAEIKLDENTQQETLDREVEEIKESMSATYPGIIISQAYPVTKSGNVAWFAFTISKQNARRIIDSSPMHHQ